MWELALGGNLFFSDVALYPLANNAHFASLNCVTIPRMELITATLSSQDISKKVVLFLEISLLKITYPPI